MLVTGAYGVEVSGWGADVVGGCEEGDSDRVVSPVVGDALYGVEVPGGVVFLSPAPVSPLGRENHSSWSGSNTTNRSTAREAGATTATFDGRYAGHASPVGLGVPCWATMRQQRVTAGAAHPRHAPVVHQHGRTGLQNRLVGGAEPFR